MRWGIPVILYLLLLSFFVSGQPNYRQLAEHYAYVEQADSLSEKSFRTFYLEKFMDDDYAYRETWRYSQAGGRIIYFQVDYPLDSSEFTEVYYLKRDDLICSEEYEKTSYAAREDQLRWGGIYYFTNARIQHVATLGRPRRVYFVPDHATGILDRFRKRFAELKRHLPMLP